VCFVVRGVCEVTLSFLANVTGCRDSRSLSFCSSPQEKRNASPYITDPSCQPNFSHLDAIIRHNEFVINILEGAISGKTAVGRLRLQYFKQVVRNTGADNYTAMKRMACNNSRWKAANQSEYWKIRRRRYVSGRHECRSINQNRDFKVLVGMLLNLHMTWDIVPFRLVIFTYASKSRSVFICTYTILRLDEEETLESLETSLRNLPVHIVQRPRRNDSSNQKFFTNPHKNHTVLIDCSYSMQQHLVIYQLFWL